MEHSGTHTGYLFALDNLGCAKNQVDAEVMIRYLEEAGWEYTEDFSRARLIIVNSCGFIEPAKEESIETTLEIRSQYPGARILLTGCLSQRYGAELSEGLEEADGVFGNRDLSRIVETAERVMEEGEALELPDYAEYDRSREKLLSFPGSSYLKISEGCSHRCSFCAIPIIRGGLRSIPRETITTEALRLIESGVFEINLIAQDLAAYGKDYGEGEFISLLRELAGLPGDYWLRLLYIHPDEFPRELISVVRDHPAVLPYFDIPFQHASPKVLRAMGRRGDAESYLSLIDEIREGLPEAVIRTTFLVGYYGEGEREFEDLLEFQRRAQFDWAGVFSYSPEEGTAALAYEGKEGFTRESGAAAEREGRLKSLQQSISEERMERFVGRSLRVLVEERVRKEDLILGRAYLQAPEVDGAAVIHLPGGEHTSEEVSGGRSLPAGAVRSGSAATFRSDAEIRPGDTIDCRIVRRNNIDLEGVIEHG
jgi:ribosomal protein S12 methylthiotransferase